MDFCGFVFPGPAQFDKATFKGTVLFASAKFKGDASFVSAKFKDVKGAAQFGRAIFEGTAFFDRATFKGYALFYGATFKDTARFESTAFKGYAQFDKATFKGTAWAAAWFDSAAFKGDASFDRAAFKGTALFYSATFKGAARFDHATFAGNALFDGATFSKSTSFQGAEFGSEYKKTVSNFNAIKVERAFDLTGASFSGVPNFCQADFKQAPDLDGVYFPLPDDEPFASGNKDLIPKYRAIRRMAIQGADYDSEQRAAKGELRSRRWIEDRRRHPALWLGILYDLAADCGRSIGRPFAIWLSSILVFAVLYIPSSKHLWDKCVTGGENSLFWRALYISGRNALVLPSSGKSEGVTLAYQCLFGSADSLPLSVSALETFVQVPLSAVLIFLFLLAVKNRFKIK